ncbi:tetratricopeptide repeat protein [Brevibacillus dissolubilis]|uniref:tetratricopeptide repeat protein n=1 Tax=Brevibacillus dissolubilis TaxID=1844116 RepID=UPI0011173099|nr:tetratricopeptide repeat protein [Brevibacillus dissolubilis]
MPKKWIRVIDEAVKKIENDEFELGIQVLQKVEEHGKDLPEVMLYLADVWYQLGHIQEAADILDEILGKGDEVSDELRQECELLLAEIALDEADYDKAQHYLYKLKDEGVDHVQLYLLLADLNSLQDLDEVAIKYLEMASQKEPDNEDIKTALGDMYAKSGDVSKALDLLGGVSEEAVSTMLLKARTYAQHGDFEESYKYYMQAAKVDQAPEILYGCGLMAFYLGRLDEALPYMEGVIAMDEEYVTAYPILADIYLSMGKTDKAIESLTTYVDLSGFELDQIRRLTALLTQAGRYEEARQYQQLLKQWDEQEEDSV